MLYQEIINNDGDWCGILSLQNDLDAWTPLHWYNAATGGITDTEHFYEYEVITQYPQWKKAIEERTIICIRNLEQVAATYPMELEHYHRLQAQSVIAVPYYRGSTGFLVIRNPQRQSSSAGVDYASLQRCDVSQLLHGTVGNRKVRTVRSRLSE